MPDYSGVEPIYTSSSFAYTSKSNPGFLYFTLKGHDTTACFWFTYNEPYVHHNSRSLCTKHTVLKSIIAILHTLACGCGAQHRIGTVSALFGSPCSVLHFHYDLPQRFVCATLHARQLDIRRFSLFELLTTMPSPRSSGRP